MIDCREFDGDFYELESKAAFIAMATNAMAMLDEGDFESLQSQKAWEGLGWYTQEIEEALREINRKINAEDPADSKGD